MLGVASYTRCPRVVGEGAPESGDGESYAILDPTALVGRKAL